MKKLLLAILFVTLSSVAYAQSNLTMGIRLQEGVNFMTGDDAWDLDEGGMGNAVGFYFNLLFPVAPSFYIHPAVGLDLTLASWEDDGYYSDIEYSTLAFNVRIPIMARYNFTPMFFGELGGAFGFNLTDQFYNEYTDDWQKMDGRKSFDFGLGGGLGLTLFFGLEFDLHYYYGLTDAYKNLDIAYSRVELGVAYWFGYHR